MIKLKTKNQFAVPTSRGVVDTTVRLIIEKIEFDNNNVRPIGYYYRIDENNQVVVLDQIGQNSLKQWEIIETIENTLPPLASSQNLRLNLIQRIREFTLLQIKQEGNENYGTISTDWVNDLDVFTDVVE